MSIKKTEIEKIKDELLNEVDRYFPKIKPMGVNKGRGEAAMIVAQAIMKFEELLEKEKTESLIYQIIGLLVVIGAFLLGKNIN